MGISIALGITTAYPGQASVPRESFEIFTKAISRVAFYTVVRELHLLRIPKVEVNANAQLIT